MQKYELPDAPETNALQPSDQTSSGHNSYSDRPVQPCGAQHSLEHGCRSIIRSDNNPVPSFICLLALLIAMGGCTSVQWRDSKGTDHHLGLIAYEVNFLRYGTQLKRISFGIDLRFSGPDRGLSIGAKRMVGWVPHTKMVERPDELLNEVLDFYRHTPTGQHQAHIVKNGILYLTEELSSEVTMVDTDNFGFNWRIGSARTGINLGYGGSHQLVGRAIDDGVVQIYLKAGEDQDAQAIQLWVLKSFPRGESAD